MNFPPFGTCVDECSSCVCSTASARLRCQARVRRSGCGCSPQGKSSDRGTASLIWELSIPSSPAVFSFPRSLRRDNLGPAAAPGFDAPAQGDNSLPARPQLAPLATALQPRVCQLLPGSTAQPLQTFLLEVSVATDALRSSEVEDNSSGGWVNSATERCRPAGHGWAVNTLPNGGKLLTFSMRGSLQDIAVLPLDMKIKPTRWLRCQICHQRELRQ